MSNPVRTCIGCAQTDDHPRHIVDAFGPAEVTWHVDCHAIATKCEVCLAQLEGLGGPSKNPKGEKLRAHLVKLGPGADQDGWTAPSDDEVLAAAETGKKG